MSITDKLKELKITIPDAPDPVGSYVAYKNINGLLLKIFLYILQKIDKNIMAVSFSNLTWMKLE